MRIDGRFAHGMPRNAFTQARILQHARSRFHVRKEHTHVDLEVMSIGIVGRIGVLHVVIAQPDRLFTGVVDDKSGTELLPMAQVFIPNGDAIEARSLVECDQTVLNQVGFSIHIHGR